MSCTSDIVPVVWRHARAQATRAVWKFQRFSPTKSRRGATLKLSTFNSSFVAFYTSHTPTQYPFNTPVPSLSARISWMTEPLGLEGAAKRSMKLLRLLHNSRSLLPVLTVPPEPREWDYKVKGKGYHQTFTYCVPSVALLSHRCIIFRGLRRSSFSNP